VVYFDTPDGSRKRKKFKTLKSARDFLTDKEVAYENLGKAIAARVDEQLKRDAHSACLLLNEFGVSLEDAAAHYRKHLLATSRSAPISGLKEEFLTQKRQKGCSKRHIDDLRSRLERFCERFGVRYAADVGMEEIEDWLTTLPDLSNVTRNHYRSKLHSFFGWCVRKRKCATNPTTAIDKVEEPPTACEIYSAEEMKTLLQAALEWSPARIKPLGKRGQRNCLEFSHRTDDVLANLVFCGFAGLRQAEFQRLTWESCPKHRLHIRRQRPARVSGQRPR